MDHENCGLPLLTVVVVDVVVFVIELELTTGLFKSLGAVCHLDADVVDDELTICVAAEDDEDLVGKLLLLLAPPGGAGAIRIGLCLGCDGPVVVEITFDEVLLFKPAIKS